MPNCPQCQKPMAHLYYGGSKGERLCLNALCPSNIETEHEKENQSIAENIRDYWTHLQCGADK